MGATTAAQAAAVGAAEYQRGEEKAAGLRREAARERAHHRTVEEHRRVEDHQGAAEEEAAAENLTQRATGSLKSVVKEVTSPSTPSR